MISLISEINYFFSNKKKINKIKVLSRIQQFLPEIAAANSKLEEQLKTQPQDNFDIENVDEEQPHIEMV